MVLSAPQSPHVFKQFLEWMIERDAEATKAICSNLMSNKSMTEGQSSQNGKKRVKDPDAPENIPAVVKKLKKD